MKPHSTKWAFPFLHVINWDNALAIVSHGCNKRKFHGPRCQKSKFHTGPTRDWTWDLLLTREAHLPLSYGATRCGYLLLETQRGIFRFLRPWQEEFAGPATFQYFLEVTIFVVRLLNGLSRVDCPCINFSCMHKMSCVVSRMRPGGQMVPPTNACNAFVCICVVCVFIYHGKKK